MYALLVGHDFHDSYIGHADGDEKHHTVPVEYTYYLPITLTVGRTRSTTFINKRENPHNALQHNWTVEREAGWTEIRATTVFAKLHTHEN